MENEVIELCTHKGGYVGWDIDHNKKTITLLGPEEGEGEAAGHPHLQVFEFDSKTAVELTHKALKMVEAAMFTDEELSA